MVNLQRTFQLNECGTQRQGITDEYIDVMCRGMPECVEGMKALLFFLTKDIQHLMTTVTNHKSSLLYELLTIKHMEVALHSFLYT